ncbi:MAG: methyltransferase domain-containing protein [Candidatus Magasanikbacteria bacterium]|nr:methyltransferase domain-containing protein [Candidatus Magasanikbacteria bacterium]
MVHAGTALIDPYPIFEKISLASGMRVADLGCGRTGHFVFPASRVVGETGIVYAVEIVKNILDSIKSRIRSEGYHNVQTIWSDIELVGKTPVPAASLHACFLVNVLFLVADKGGALAEAARLVEPGGLVVVVDWARRLGPLGPPPEKMVSPEAIIALAKQASLELTEKLSPGEYHYCLIFKKK